jgi:hypothetical protein
MQSGIFVVQRFGFRLDWGDDRSIGVQEYWIAEKRLPI